MNKLDYENNDFILITHFLDKHHQSITIISLTVIKYTLELLKINDLRIFIIRFFFKDKQTILPRI